MNIPLFKIYTDSKDIERVKFALNRGANWAIGPDIKEFQENISAYLKIKHVVLLNSGTSALHVALYAHNIGIGDEVIVPSFTFIATANAALFVGATPVFAEIEDKYYGLDPTDVERRITPRTKAIIPVHYAGCPCNIEELRQIAIGHNLVLIEDAAESLGATVKGKKVGTFGDSGILSFCQNKIISTGEGGAFITDDSKLSEQAKLISSHGRPDTLDYFSTAEYIDYITLGYNFRMSNITAALGIAQIEKIEPIIQMRRNNALYLSQQLSEIEEIIVPSENTDISHVYQMYTIRLRSLSRRDKLVKWLTDRGISCKIYFYPIHLSYFYRQKYGYKVGDLPLTEKISLGVLTLPMFPSLTKEEMDYISYSIKEFFIKG